MSYSLTQIKKYACDSIKNIIPLDDESVNEMINYTLSNYKTRNDISSHLLDILGPSEASFQFVNTFCNMLLGSSSKHQEEANKPEDMKAVAIGAKKAQSVPKGKITGVRLVKVKQAPSTKSENKGRMANNTRKGTNISEMFDNKPSTVAKTKLKSKEVRKKVESIQELDDLLLQLEISEEKRNTGDVRVCNCNATRHPLFEMYPNCLNCGKIICSKEGLQPCSFCGKSLISDDDKNEMMNVIEIERKALETEADKGPPAPENMPKKKKNVIKITLNNTGQNNFKVQEQLYKQIKSHQTERKELEEARKQEEEVIEQNKRELEYYKSMHKKDEELVKAEERLAMLLNFQDNGAERTKIIDHASDFEVPTGGGSLWASPIERVLQFKRQQKQQKRLQDKELSRSGRGETVLHLSIENGQAVLNDRLNEADGLDDDLSDDEEIRELKEKLNHEKKLQFNRDIQNVYDPDKFNEKLVKPIYKGTKTSSSSDTDSQAMVSGLPPLGTVVQMGDMEEQENQLFTMVGV